MNIARWLTLPHNEKQLTLPPSYVTCISECGVNINTGNTENYKKLHTGRLRSMQRHFIMTVINMMLMLKLTVHKL
jgi:hypothetical protein